MSSGSHTPDAVARSRASGLAWTGALLGTVGLFVLNLVFGPVAIGLGATALRRGTQRWAALAAIALGVGDVAVLAALMLGAAPHGIVWRFGA